MFCPEDDCTSTFETTDKLSLHIVRGEDTTPKLLSGMGRAKTMFEK